MTFRSVLIAVSSVVLALVLQTTLFGRLTISGIAPDVVLIAVLLVAIRRRSESAIVLAFLSGLAFDTLSSTALGLRAAVYTSVAFLAIRTIDRMDSGPVTVAVWVGLMTLGGVVLFLIVGSLFGQVTLDPGEAMRRAILVPIYNLVIALLLAPVTSRLLAPSRHGFS